MDYYANIESGYILGVGENGFGTEITEQEYNNILTVIRNRPDPPAGYDYLLKTDLTWELHELPPEPEQDATPEDYEAALNRLGVET